MDFGLYPFDTNVSLYYSSARKEHNFPGKTKFITYKWTKVYFLSIFQKFFTEVNVGRLGTDMNQDVKFDFFVEELTADEFYFLETNETFSRSGFTLIMERSPTPFFMNTYIPTALLTLSSFIGFLIPVDMVPGRMAVLVTTFLMLVNISNTERDRGPEVRLKKTEGGREK